MKKSLIALLACITAALMLLIGSAALAEAAAEPEAPASSSAEDALEEAWNAYYAAKSAASLTDYEQELADMVAQGLLTQEQADLLLKAMQDSAALSDGKCPNCGYEFSCGRNGRNGGRGMHNGRKGFGRP